jgi:WD40 repeat protein
MQGPHLPGNCAMPLAASIGDAAYGLAFHQPTGLLAAATRGGYVAVLDPSSRYVSSGSPRQLPAVSTIAPMRGAILREQESMAWLAVPIRAVGADHDNLAILTLHNGRLDNGPPLALRAAGPGEIRRLSASVQNHRLATFACATGGEASCTVTVWQYDDAFNLTPVVSLSRDEFGGLKPGRIALSADGQRLVVCFTTGNRLLTVPVAAGGKVTAIETDLQEVNEIAFSGDGANFAAGGRVSTGDMSPSADGVQLWRVNGSGFEVSRRSPLHSLPSVNRVYELGFAEDRDGNVLLLVGEQYGGIDLLDVRSGRWLPQLRGDSRSILQLAFSRHTSLVAAADSDNVVRLWDTARWTRASLDASGPIKPLELTLSTDSDQGPGFLAFGGEGTWLASGAGKLRLWDLDVDSLVRDVCARLREPGQHGAESAAPLWSKDRPCTLR